MIQFRWDKYIPGQGWTKGKILFPTPAEAYKWLLQQPPEIRNDPTIDLVAVEIPDDDADWVPESEPEVQAQ